MMNINNNQNAINVHGRLVEQAAVTFFSDCIQRGKKIQKRTTVEDNPILSYEKKNQKNIFYNL